jgi:hypothetical protein
MSESENPTTGLNLRENFTVNFAGLTSFENFTVDIPERLMDKLGTDERPEMSFSEALRELPIATEGEIQVVNPYNPTTSFGVSKANAVINPDVADAISRGTDVPGDAAVYAVSSDKYTIVNPVDAWTPLGEALQEASLADQIAGEFRVYDYGARVHADIYFLDGLVYPPNGREPLFTGLQLGNSFDGSVSLYAQGFAYDTLCNNSFRGLTPKKERRHVGAAERAKDWYLEILNEMGAVRDHLLELITQALDITVDFVDQPYSVEEYYEFLGFPAYLAHAAARDAQSRSVSEGGSPVRINKWVLHSGATYALTHVFRGTREEGALEDYYFMARRILDNPYEVMEVVGEQYEHRERQRAEAEAADGEGGDLSIEQRQGLARIETFQNSLAEKKEEFETREKQMEELFARIGQDGAAE